MPRVTMLFLLALTMIAGSASAKDRKPPYWASISATEARMRTGPALKYPATWMYRRADLPIRVIETYPSWRKVQDPDGTTGWMLVRLLSDARTAIVLAGEARELRENPTPVSTVVYRIQPGVIGRVSKCARGWCRIDVKGRAGYIRTDDLWGVDPNEKID